MGALIIFLVSLSLVVRVCVSCVILNERKEIEKRKKKRWKKGKRNVEWKEHRAETLKDPTERSDLEWKKWKNRDWTSALSYIVEIFCKFSFKSS
jgi:hypothetical protein